MLGTENPLAEISRLAHEAGALVLADGAQAAPKLGVDVGALGVDFYGLTGHKAYGPTGIGALWARLELLDEMPPFLGGGSMIRKVTKQGTTWADPPARFEAGTPAIAQAIGMAAAFRWLDGLGMDAVAAHEREIAAYALDRLAEVPDLRVFGPPPSPERLGPVSFELEGVHAHDVSEILDRHGVAVRAGHHCAQPLMERLGVAATARASFGVYTTPEEIDRLVEGLLDAQARLRPRLSGPRLGTRQRTQVGSQVLALARARCERLPVATALEEVVGDLAPAGQGLIALRGAAVDQVRRPDQRLALAQGRVVRLQPLALDQRGDELLVIGVLGAGGGVDVPPGHLGEPVAARVVDQRPLVGPDVLERDPDAAHEPGRLGVEVHRVGVRALLAADAEVERLERQRLAPVGCSQAARSRPAPRRST